MHIYSLGPKLLQSNFFLQILQLSIRSGAHKRFRRFFDFSQFLTAISQKLWRHLAKSMRTKQSIWKRNPFWIKGWKPRRNRATNGNAMLVRTMHPSSARCSGLGVWPTAAFPPPFADWGEILHSQADQCARQPCKDWPESIGGGSYWAGRAAARPLFRLRGPQICLARPLLATWKHKM